MLKILLPAAMAAVLMASPAVAAVHDYSLGALKIADASSRPTPPGAPTAAGYLTITNTGRAPDQLVGGDSPLAGKVEIHQMSMTSGIMRMRVVPGGLPIPAGQTVRLEPGGYHLMLIGPKRAFRIGDSIPVTLRFQRAGTVRIDLDVQALSPAGAMAMGVR
jgi:hypothetical protein